MDTPEKPQRSWWRRKRWLGGIALLLCISYPASIGPLFYCSGRGWVPAEVHSVLVRPCLEITIRFTEILPEPWNFHFSHCYKEYRKWWWELGVKHAAEPG